MAAIDRSLAVRLERVWAEHALDVAGRLAAMEPTLGTYAGALADGFVVLQGPGMYTNRALALGLLGPVGDHHLDELDELSARVGVPAAVELCPFSDDALGARCAERGMVAGTDVSVLACADPAAMALDDDPTIVVAPIAGHELALWQQVSAAAWEIGTEAGRRASDAYSAAANATSAETLVLARDAGDGRPLGCATIIVRDGIGSLAGMSTLPAERRHGVQRALVRRRIRLALEAGCTTAAVSAVAGGASERNLVRLGFSPVSTKATFTRPIAGERTSG